MNMKNKGITIASCSKYISPKFLLKYRRSQPKNSDLTSYDFCYLFLPMEIET